MCFFSVQMPDFPPDIGIVEYKLFWIDSWGFYQPCWDISLFLLLLFFLCPGRGRMMVLGSCSVVLLVCVNSIWRWVYLEVSFMDVTDWSWTFSLGGVCSGGFLLNLIVEFFLFSELFDISRSQMQNWCVIRRFVVVCKIVMPAIPLQIYSIGSGS